MHRILACLALLIAPALAAAQAEPPRVTLQDGASRLLVHGHPFLIRGGELANSAAGTAAQADDILPRLARLHLNTLLMPVAWEQIEPVEGQYDFSILDHWIDAARQQNLHLVLLWFGSWKNAFSEYAPTWVKSDTKRFPRCISADGLPTEILSPLGDQTEQADARAFAALMRHIRERDASQQTILFVQVENEIGFLGRGGRDRSDAANRIFDAAAPDNLIHALQAALQSRKLSPELAAHFNPHGHTWSEVFGEAADEVFMAWHYGRFIDAVAAAGKKEDPLPMYANAQLPAPFERAGDYPSGGPHPYDQDIYRAAAPSIDFYAPDIYWPDFEYWVDRYRSAGNPVFVPEARLAGGQYNALYVYGEALGFGFSPFAVDSLPASRSASPANSAAGAAVNPFTGPASDAGAAASPVPGPQDAHSGPTLSDVYAVLEHLSDTILEAQPKHAIRALLLHATSPRPTRTVVLGGYLFDATLSRSWPARSLETEDGAMMVIETGPDEFLMAGSGLTVSIARDPDADSNIAEIASIEQVSWADGKWLTQRRLNGDQSNQGRQLQLDAHAFGVYRVKLLSYPRDEQRQAGR